MNARILFAGLTVLGISGGALAGLDAAGAVDGFYTAPREPRFEPLPPLAPNSTLENRTFAAAPPAGTIWGQEIGRKERVFFAETVPAELPPEPVADDWRPEPSVRVHRATVPAAEPVSAEPVEPAEEPVNGWADAPPPEQLPTAN